MRRRLIGGLSGRLAVVYGSLRQQGGGAPISCLDAAATARIDPWLAVTGGLSACPGLRRAQLHAARGFSAPTPAPDPLEGVEEDGLPGTSLAEGGVEVAANGIYQRVPLAAVPAYVEAHLQGMKPDDLVAVVEQLIDVHFCEAEEDSLRPTPLAGTMSRLIQLVLGQGSGLAAEGEVVSGLLWGAYRLDMRLNPEQKEALLEAAERTQDSCGDDGVAIAHALCALGGLGLRPSNQYFIRLGARLGEEGLARSMVTDYLLLALQGVALLQDVPPGVAVPLMQELLMKATSEGLDAVEVGRLARFLASLPPSLWRDLLAEQLFSHAGAPGVAPFLDVFAVKLVLRCAAALGAKLDAQLLRTLVQRAHQQLGAEAAFHVAGALLWSLGKLGCSVGDGVITPEFARACVDTHMANVARLQSGAMAVPFRVPLRGAPISQALVDFLEGCNQLGVELAPGVLQPYVELLEDPGSASLSEDQLRSLLAAFEAMQFQPGVAACAARLAA